MQIRFHQNNIAGIQCNITAASNCHPYICLYQSRSIVDTVSYHHDTLSVFLQTIHDRRLIIWQYFCNHMVYANFLTDIICCQSVVTSQHMHFNSQLFDFSDGLHASFLQSICHTYKSNDFSVQSYKHWRLSFTRNFICLFFKLGPIKTFCITQFFISNIVCLFSYYCLDSLSGNTLESLNTKQFHASFFGSVYNGLS